MILRLAAAFASIALAAASFPGHAQVFRAFLSATGSDANPCTLAAPCRLLPAALAAVVDGGEVWMLDSANYNTATVNVAKSVSIVSAPGVQGSLVTNGTTALAVGTAGLKVALRGVFLVPLATAVNGAGDFGLDLTADSQVVLDRCVIAGLASDGIRVTAGKLDVMDSVIRDNAGRGVTVIPGAGGAIVDLTQVRLVNNVSGGLRVNASQGTTRVTISDSAISGLSTASGSGVILLTSASAAVVSASVIRSKLLNYNAGMLVQNNGAGTGSVTGTLSSSLVSGNATGLVQIGTGQLFTLGDNHLATNTVPSSGVISTGNLQ